MCWEGPFWERCCSGCSTAGPGTSSRHQDPGPRAQTLGLGPQTRPRLDPNQLGRAKVTPNWPAHRCCSVIDVLNSEQRKTGRPRTQDSACYPDRLPSWGVGGQIVTVPSTPRTTLPTSSGRPTSPARTLTRRPDSRAEGSSSATRTGWPWQRPGRSARQRSRRRAGRRGYSCRSHADSGCRARAINSLLNAMAGYFTKVAARPPFPNSP
jgi:hypothetical protein